MPMSEYVRSLRSRIGNDLLEAPTVSVVTFDARGRVLLVRNLEDGLWSTPGGMIEPLEIPADAAVREMWEETGLLVELTHIVGVIGGPECTVTYGNGDRMAWVATLFAGRPIGGRLQPDGVETIEARYVARDEWRSLPCRSHLPLFLEAAFDPSHAPHFRPPTWRPPQP